MVYCISKSIGRLPAGVFLMENNATNNSSVTEASDGVCASQLDEVCNEVVLLVSSSLLVYPITCNTTTALHHVAKDFVSELLLLPVDHLSYRCFEGSLTWKLLSIVKRCTDWHILSGGSESLCK